LHDPLADRARGDLPLRVVLHHLLDLVDDRREGLRRHRALLAGAVEPGHELLAVERLPPAVLLDDEVRDLLDPLVRGEPAAAGEALPAPADRVPRPRLARVHDLVLEMTAERALHRALPGSVCEETRPSVRTSLAAVTRS